VPRRNDISTILVIGSGPIVIGQACEFDYSGTQACRVLREEGYRVVLANSNPATIMTDPDFADRTYIEPLTVEVLAAIIERERPDAVLPTLGGQTALNLAMALHERGLVGVPGTPELIGANAEAISTAEDREKFKAAMIEIGLGVPRSGVAHTMDEARDVLADIGLPVIIRPAYILGGRGTGIASTMEEFERVVANGIAASPISEVLIETSIVGWKEYELEVMRDRADNCVIICSIENVDAMGVHTGDSITVAPAMTLSDVEYQTMRDAALACIRRVGVETGGSNVQFAVNPRTGEQVVIEMNPRVSRSSALASKATGFPIAKIAAKLAVGYTLDEIPNDITKMTPASFEPTIDYVVTKVPRWAFEKFAGASDELGTQMRSVGEVMAIGRTFPESLQKALRSLERGRLGLNCDPAEDELRAMSDADLLAAIARPTSERIFQIGECLRRGIAASTVHERSHVDPWFLDQMLLIVEHRAELASAFPMPSSPTCGVPKKMRCARCAKPPACFRRTSRSTRAVPSSPRRRRTSTRRGRTRARCVTPMRSASSSSAAARTASARESSSTTAACTRASHCAPPATRPSCSTATPRRCRPTTTRPTVCTSSRSPARTCSTSSPPKPPPRVAAHRRSSCRSADRRR